MAEAKKSRRVVVFITGYGPFGTVKVNPSASIAKLVGKDLERHPAVVAVHAELSLAVSIKAVGAYFDQLEGEIEKTIAEHGSDVKILLCHIGVHPDTTGLIRAEVQGYNELYASLPDVDGVVLNHDPILPSDGSIDVTLESWFGKAGTPQLQDLESLIGQLNTASKSTAGFASAATPLPHEVAADQSKEGEMVMPAFQPPHWSISRDAGRYLCNCALYRALRLQKKHPNTVYGIFIHVVDPTKGKMEENGERVVAYNPTVMSQSEEVKKFVDGLLTMMTAA
ncbi:putative Pyroglutamyl-peptidase I (PGP) [Leptomonas pyrrhocoris]|uniref:Putative Pyroglutamyl-peptidase I (PGP) n=1 Tax=Leptomonas pyrrhocoris TaxID=157538 RepID=A0A0N0DWU5_LEPPY|nr:putative Pyroglutamyl-peptidase I (PGP) [Leptomonas pyrrhocoris]XP_015660674.1 putative Pyroglutamyl-peptidase I (PGP) [Leptomonas pyrrhocoris]XP_015660675.1 putative Pyroglutamyl-peptidase I (PGP) [Leptomonas pyrrhocoris]KPA82234.1 putative Pyroglutamyl-peptidase I (PGP) [Leptomonas pyrrhocoris]KPA82235.1 putative Pyroglutamyl-peptidase I (PGP) [Leptomonas pyrrhocoris]KPA82236.1 putative Pyroglutamyl-peptidase I (PGP) [Leptomonas pyrrhocoris]|eukprot:XP_015660673.1 putative Pyroglutamyl-peptidase I (PGP) [Leptomonas pyrrhocoris]